MTGVTSLAAVGGALANGAPTGIDWWDAILKAGLAAAFVLGVGRGPVWVAVIVATVAAMFIGDSVWLAPVAVGLVLAIGAGALPRQHHWMKPVSAALVVQGLLRFSSFGFFGLPSLIAGFAIGLALIFGYHHADRAIRRIVRSLVLVGSLAVVVCSVVGGIVLLGARADVERGISAARTGLTAARNGNTEKVVVELEQAAVALSAAESRSTGLLAQPLRLLPVLAQHRNAITVATGQGAAIARQASRATIEADISSIRMSVGAVDLSALSSMEGDLVTTVELFETGIEEIEDARSPWLVRPVATRLDSLTDEMRSVLPDARVAAHAARVIPGLLGQDEPRRYFVAFGSPAESREFGGFVGSWALLEFDQGSVRQVDAGRISALYELTRSQEQLSTEIFPAWFVDRGQPDNWPQNITRSPEISVVAGAARQLFDGLAGGPIDGFVYLDGYALSRLLDMTGPVRIDGVDGQINARNAPNFFFDEQYRLTDRSELKAELSEIFAQIFEGFLEVELPGPERLGQLLGPVARQGRLQVATFDEDENDFLRSVKLQRDFARPTETVDALALVQANGSVSKLDLYLHRELSYDVKVDEDGLLTALATVELTSDIPDNAPVYVLGGDTPGLNVVRLSLYTPHMLQSVHLDGRPAELREVKELGYNRYEVTVELPANSTRIVEYELVGQVDPASAYDLSVWSQPLVNDDIVHFRYLNSAGLSTQKTLELIENTVFLATEF